MIACKTHPSLIAGLNEAGYNCMPVENINRVLALNLVVDCVGIITSTKLNIDRELIDAAPMLQWVGRMGSGMEIVDVPYANQKGVVCYSSPEGNCNAVGEHALGMLLSLTRNIARGQDEMQSAIWKREENRGTELEGKTIGIIGFGHTGRAFAKKLSGFDANILAYDKFCPVQTSNMVKSCTDLQMIYEQADIVSFHVPLQADTFHYFNDSFYKSMQKPFILINTSRGQVVNTTTLLTGLKEGKIKGACLDVFEKEPPFIVANEWRSQIDELVALPQVIVTPHIAGYTFEAEYKMGKVLLEKIVGAEMLPKPN